MIDNNSLFITFITIVIIIAIINALIRVNKDHGYEDALKFNKFIAEPSNEKNINWARNFIRFDTQSDTPIRDSQEKWLFIYKPEFVSFRPAKMPVSAIGLCILLGIFGTFLGINDGLRGIDFSATAPRALENQLTILIGGMQTAFISSVAGMSGAILLTIIFTLIKHLNAINTFTSEETIKARDNFKRYAREMYATELLADMNPEMMAKSAKEQSEASSNLAIAALSLQDGITNLNNAAQNLSADAIGAAVGVKLDESIENRLNPTFEKIARELETLRKIKADNGEKTIELISKQLIEPLKFIIYQNLEQNKQTNISVTRLSDSVANLTETLDQATGRMKEDIEQIRKFQNETLSHMRSFADDLKQASEAASQSVIHSVEESRHSMRELFDSVRSEMASTTQMMHEEAERQSKLIEQAGEQAADVLNNARESLINGIHHIEKIISDMRQTTQNELALFRNAYQTELSTFLKEQNSSLETVLGKQKEALTAAADAFRDAMSESANEQRKLLQEISDQVITLREGLEEVGKFAERHILTVAANNNALRENAEHLAQSSYGLATRYADLQQSLEEAFKTQHTYLHEHLKLSEDARQKFFEQADESFNLLGKRITEHVEVINDSSSKLRIILEHSALDLQTRPTK